MKLKAIHIATHFLFLFILPFMNLSAASKKNACKSSVSKISSKVSEENAVPGARVRVAAEIKPKSIFGMPNPFLDGLRIRSEDGINALRIAKPFDELEIIEAPRKLEGVNTIVVKHLASGVVGHIFWNDFRLSTILISEGEPLPAKIPKKTNTLKFALSQDFHAEEKGLTRYGRPYAKPGDFVWIGNLPRTMSPKSIGRISPSKKIESTGKGTFPIVELINGKSKSEDAHWIIPLNPEEIREIKEVFADQIKVDWFQ